MLMEALRIFVLWYHIYVIYFFWVSCFHIWSQIYDEQIPKLSLEIKDLELDLFKQDLASTVLGAKLSIKPFMMYFGERHSRYENSGPMIGFRQRIFSVARPPPAQLIDAIPSVLFLLDHLTVSSSFDHDGYAFVSFMQSSYFQLVSCLHLFV